MTTSTLGPDTYDQRPWKSYCWPGTTATNGISPGARPRIPYAILVSEVMLQQTQVDRVSRATSPGSSAGRRRTLSPGDGGDVIRAWQGLGYNRRALALHRAAQVIAREGWPDDLTSLPGVGPYTAAAIRNFAFGEDVLPHDVNVDRVERRTGHGFSRRGRPGADGSRRHRSASRGSRAARRARWRSNALRGAPATSRRGSRAGSRARSASGGPRRCAPWRLAGASRELDPEAVDALARDGLVVLFADGTVSLP